MRIFFQTFLYVNVGIGSLFFGIWLWTAFPFSTGARAEEPTSTVPDNKKSPKIVVSESKEVLPEKSNPSSNNKKGSLPLEDVNKADSLVEAEPAKGNKPSQELVQNKGVQRAPNSDNLPVPPPPSSPSGVDSSAEDLDLNTRIKSAQELAKKKGAVSASAANELMGVNQRVVEIHEMLSSYEYDPSGRRDPFIPFRPKGLETEEEEVLNHATSGYELSEIKLIGMKWGTTPGFSKAMFRTPDSEIHYLQAKDRIGSGGAIIDRLGEDKVVVLEPRFALESQSRSSASGGSERVFVPKIIYLSRFARQESEEQERASNTSSAMPSQAHNPSPIGAGGKTKKNKVVPRPSSGTVDEPASPKVP